MREITISGKEAGQRLDKFLFRYLPGAGKSFLYKQLRKKNIVLNRKKAEGKELLQQGDHVAIYFSEETLEKFQGLQKESSGPALDPSAVLYEDEDVLVINKPAGMLSQKAAEQDVSLVEYLRGYLLRSGACREEDFLLYRPGVCNRLDRNTSGLVLCGKNLQAAQQLTALIRDRAVGKYYLALVKGEVKASFRISGWLRKDTAANRVTVSREPAEGAARIETACRPLAEGEGCTLLEVELITGRTHQIRAQLAALGHPLAGDPAYGDPGWNKVCRASYGLRRQFLHAARMEFPAGSGVPEGCAGRSFRAPLPEDLQHVIRKIFGTAPVL